MPRRTASGGTHPGDLPVPSLCPTPPTGSVATVITRLRPALTGRPVRIVGSGVGLLLLARSVDLHAVGAELRHADTRWLALAMILTGLSFAATVLQWGLLLRTACRDVSWRQITSWQAQSIFFGHIGPTPAAGDGVRIYNGSRVAGCGPGLAALLGSRLASTLGMAIWGLAGAILLRGAFGAPVLLAASLFAGCTLLTWVAVLQAGSLVRRLGAHPGGCRRRIADVLHPVIDAFDAVGREGQAVAACILGGAAGWGINLLALGALGRAVGVDVPIALFAVAVPVSLLATLSPVAVNGMGLREGVLAGLLVHGGVDQAHAGGLALMLDAQMLPIALAGAALWCLARRRRDPGRAAASVSRPLPQEQAARTASGAVTAPATAPA